MFPINILFIYLNNNNIYRVLGYNISALCHKRFYKVLYSNLNVFCLCFSTRLYAHLKNISNFLYVIFLNFIYLPKLYFNNRTCIFHIDDRLIFYLLVCAQILIKLPAFNTFFNKVIILLLALYIKHKIKQSSIIILYFISVLL